MSYNRPQSSSEARSLARKMCEAHWGPEKGPFESVPWDWDLKRDHNLIYAAQDEIKKYLRENNLNYQVSQMFPEGFYFN